jgi:hypothetical protein
VTLTLADAVGMIFRPDHPRIVRRDVRAFGLPGDLQSMRALLQMHDGQPSAHALDQAEYQ